MKIRTATPEDLDNISKVEEICFPEAEAAKKEDFCKRLKVFPNHFFIMEENGEAIGFINGMVTNSETISDEMFKYADLHMESGKWQSVFGLDVLPEFRGNGYASKLMNVLIESAKNENRKGCILTCKKHLVHYYEKFGFKNVGISKSVHGGVVWYDMILEF